MGSGGGGGGGGRESQQQCLARPQIRLIRLAIAAYYIMQESRIRHSSKGGTQRNAPPHPRPRPSPILSVSLTHSLTHSLSLSGLAAHLEARSQCGKQAATNIAQGHARVALIPPRRSPLP